MKPTHYFIDADVGNQPKNKLQKEFMEYLVSLNGTLISYDEFIYLSHLIRKKSEELNEEYHRCKPLKVSFWETYKNEFAINSNMSFVQFRIKPCTLKSLRK